jgi:hypothetical protein
MAASVKMAVFWVVTPCSPRHVRNSVEHINAIKSLCPDIVISFNVVALFTTVPTGEAQHLLSRDFDEDIPRRFRYVLASSFFTFNGQFYEQTDGGVMGSSLSRAIANFFMEQFQDMAP